MQTHCSLSWSSLLHSNLTCLLACCQADCLQMGSVTAAHDISLLQFWHLEYIACLTLCFLLCMRHQRPCLTHYVRSFAGHHCVICFLLHLCVLGSRLTAAICTTGTSRNCIDKQQKTYASMKKPRQRWSSCSVSFSNYWWE